MKIVDCGCRVHALCTSRKAKLEESRRFYQFLQDSEEEEAWIVEKIRIVKSEDVGKDLRAVIGLLKKHEVCRHSFCLWLLWQRI